MIVQIEARHHIRVTGLKVRWTVDSRNQIFRLMDTYRDARALRKVLSAQATKAILIGKLLLQACWHVRTVAVE